MVKKNLKYILLIYVLFVCFAYGYKTLNSQNIPSEVKNPEFKAQADEAINAFQKSLKSALMSAMSDGGTQQAVKVCNEQAPEIANEISLEQGMTLSRTSLKYRNPNNKPSKWQEKILEDFDIKNKNGTPLNKLSFLGQENENIYYMKAIPMMGMCASCHGDYIEPELNKTIKSYYPKDKAVGFDVGDIRGAFVVTKPDSSGQ